MPLRQLFKQLLTQTTTAAAVSAEAKPVAPVAAEPTPGPAHERAPGPNTLDATASVLVPGWSFPFQAGDRSLTGQLWDGTPLTGPLALDTETSMPRADHEVPSLALAVASDGARNVLILPDQLAGFLEAHQDRHLIFLNVSFDYEVMMRRLGEAGAKVLHDMAHNCQLHDAGTLARLLDIAAEDQMRDGSYSLGALAERHLGIPMDKENPYRTRFGELVHHNWEEPVDPRFLSYALPDAFITLQLWKELKQQALELRKRYTIPGAKVLEFGLLGESLITRSDVAIGRMYRRGIRVDRDKALQACKLLEQETTKLVQEIDAIEPEYFSKHGVRNRSRAKPGSYRFSGKSTVVPSTSTTLLRERLEVFAQQNDIIPRRTAKDSLVSTSTKFWNDRCQRDPFLSRWCKLEESKKLLQFFPALQQDRIYPKYGCTVTMRMTATSPNIQQLPCREEFRRFVLPDEGQLLIGADYSSIESVMLAAYCYEAYGASTLRDVLLEGRKVHDYTASWLLKMDYNDFLAMGESDDGAMRDKYKHHRQKAKILNFGIPGGFTPQSICDFALQNHRMVITLEEAEQLHEEYITQIYPELQQFMRDDMTETVAANLSVPTEAVREHFPEEWMLPTLRRLCNGETSSRIGRPYSESMIDDLFRSLAELDVQGDYANALAVDDFKRLRHVFGHTAISYAGTIRGGVRSNVRCNSAFQSRAALGLRRALWNLHHSGFDLITAIHDEILVGVPEDGDHTALADQLNTIMCESMAPFAADIPVQTELYLARHWSKEAKEVRDKQTGELLVWGPNLNAIAPVQYTTKPR